MKQVFSLSIFSFTAGLFFVSFGLTAVAWANNHYPNNSSHRYYSGHGDDYKWHNYTDSSHDSHERSPHNASDRYEGHSYVKMPYFKHHRHHWWDR